MFKKTVLFLHCILLLYIVCFSNYAEANYKQAIKKIKQQYEDAWIAELEDDPAFRIAAIKYVQATEKKYLNKDPAPSDLWLITTTGNIFKSSDLALALKDIKYFPTNDVEAITVASMLIKYNSDCVSVITENGIDGNYMPKEFLKIGKKPSVLKDKDGAYNVILYVSHCSPPRYYGSTHFTLEINKIKISRYEYTIYEKTTIKTIDNRQKAQ